MKVKQLKDIAEFLDYRRRPLNEQERRQMKGNIPYYGANGLVDYIDDYIFDEELVLLAEDGGNFGSKTKPIAYKISGKSWVNNHAHVLRTINGTDLDYLKWSLSFIDVTKYVTGSTRIKLTKTDAEKIEIKLPELQVQKEIASLLNDIEVARQKRKAANALTDQFLQSTFLSMFGDPISNEYGFDKASITDLKCQVQIGPFGTQLHVEDYIENGIPLINPTHIQDKKIVESSKLTITKDKHAELSNYHLRQDDVIMARRGEMARCAIITKREENWLCGTGSLFVRPSKHLNSIFLLHVLSHSSIKRKLENDAQGVTMANLNKTIVENLEIINPPLSLQQKFASIVADTEQLRQKQKQSEIELENLFQALLQKYFG